MSKQISAAHLIEAGGSLSSATKVHLKGVALSRRLAGNLTVFGVANEDGTPAEYVIPAKSGGFVPAPGTGIAWAPNYQYADESDGGAAYAVFEAL